MVLGLVEVLKEARALGDVFGLLLDTTSADACPRHWAANDQQTTPIDQAMLMCPRGPRAWLELEPLDGARGGPQAPVGRSGGSSGSTERQQALLYPPESSFYHIVEF